MGGRTSAPPAELTFGVFFGHTGYKFRASTLGKFPLVNFGQIPAFGLQWLGTGEGLAVQGLEPFETRNPHCETRNPKPEARTHKLETQNPKPETRDPKPETRNPQPETRNPKPKTRNPKPNSFGGYGRGKE